MLQRDTAALDKTSLFAPAGMADAAAADGFAAFASLLVSADVWHREVKANKDLETLQKQMTELAVALAVGLTKLKMQCFISDSTWIQITYLV